MRPNGIGPWQEVEYFTAFDRHVKDKSFAVVPDVNLLDRAEHQRLLWSGLGRQDRRTSPMEGTAQFPANCFLHA
jgi:hypothetical protein